MRDVPVHACPASGESLTPCCGKTMFELPRSHRIASDPALVTCMTGSDPRVLPPDRPV